MVLLRISAYLLRVGQPLDLIVISQALFNPDTKCPIFTQKEHPQSDIYLSLLRVLLISNKKRTGHRMSSTNKYFYFFKLLLREFYIHMPQEFHYIHI